MYSMFLAPAPVSRTAIPHGRQSALLLPTRPFAGAQSRFSRKPSTDGRHIVQSQSKNDKAHMGVIAKNPNPAGSPFSDAILRSFALGLSAGALFETAHVAVQFASFAAGLGYQNVLGSLPAFLEDFSPAFFADHVAAFAAWALFYVIEAIAIMTVLKQNKNADADSMVDKLQNMSTLPKFLLPSKLSLAKRLLFNRQTAVAGATAGATPAEATKMLSRDYVKQATPADNTRDPTSSTSMPTMGVSSTLDSRPSLEAAFAKPAPLPPKPVQPPFKKAPLLDPVERRTREIEERKAYLKNFWYAAALSETVKDTPVKVDMLGRRIVLWRDAEGKVSAMDDACPHRGAPLSQGWVDHDVDGGHSCIVCPYHGWAFDGEAKLREVPSQDKSQAGKWPKRPLLDTYPIEEKGGFIWLFFGSKSLPADERPPIPYCEELDDPKWRAVYGELEFDVGHWAVFENAIDMAHIHYLHGDSFGNRDTPSINDMTAERLPFGVSAKFHIKNKPVSLLWEWSRVPQVPVEARAMLPSTSYVKIELAYGVQMITFVSTVPISENRAINRFCLIRNFALTPLADGVARKSMFKILGEDKVMVDELQPDLVRQEISVAADLPQIEFRKLRQEYIDMGYGVAPRLEEQRKQGL